MSDVSLGSEVTTRAAEFLQTARQSRDLVVSYLRQGKPGRAFAHFLLVLTLQPESRLEEDFKDSFVSTLCAWGQDLEALGRLDDVMACYRQALDIFPEDEEILNNLGTHALRCGSSQAARGYYLRALAASPHFLPAARNLQHANDSAVERWHFRMLNDRRRNLAFRRAIAARVGRGHDRVLDIGAGTGILSVFAVEAGAKEVAACDHSPTMVDVAAQVLRANGADSVRLLARSSTDLLVPDDLPQRVSLVVTETLDAGAFGEDILRTLLHAWDSLLLPPPPANPEPGSQPYGFVIPSRVSVTICGIECDHLLRKNSFPESDLLVFPDGFIRDLCGEPYDTEELRQVPGGFRLLTEERTVVEVDFNSRGSIAAALARENFAVELRCVAGGRLDAIAAWFRLDVDGEGDVLSSRPEEESCWDQAVFPLLPASCLAGEVIRVDVGCAGGKLTTGLAGRKPCGDTASEEMILFANDAVVLRSLKTLADSFSGRRIGRVLDLSPVPIFGMELAKRSIAQRLTCVTNPRDERALREMVRLNGVPNVTFVSKDEVLATDGSFDVVVADLVDPSGELKADAVNRVPLLRSLLTPTGLLLPESVTVCCQLLDCDWLETVAAVVGDERTCGCRVAEFVNAYQSRLHLDLHLCSVTHTTLSDPVEFADLNLASPTDRLATRTATTACTRAGRLSAVAIWYAVRWAAGGNAVSTRRVGSRAGQAAVVLRPAARVEQGQTVDVVVGYMRGVVDVRVEGSR